MQVVRILLRDDPQAVCRVLQLVRSKSAEASELQVAARAQLNTQQRLFELRLAAGLEAEGTPPPAPVERPPWPAPVTQLILNSFDCRWRVSEGHERARVVARFVRVSGSLQRLYLSGPQIKDEGAKSLAAALAVNVEGGMEDRQRYATVPRIIPSKETLVTDVRTDRELAMSIYCTHAIGTTPSLTHV